MLVYRLMISLVVALALQGCASSANWYRGNTHTHTTRSDGDSAPEVVVKWYLDHGYNFLVLSDHNTFTDPQSVEFPPDPRADFILIPGVEITGKKTVHTTALNLTATVPWELDHDDKAVIIQSHVDGALNAGGLPILAHPNFGYAIAARDILPVERLNLFEVYNGHPSVHNAGDETHPSTEALWDELLTGGMTIYGIASDDAHHFQEFSDNKANPGRGWIMVKSSALNANDITAAIAKGEFYSSTGVFLKVCRRSGKTYTLEIDEEKTMRELTSSARPGKYVATDRPGYTIEFIGPQGKVLKAAAGAKAVYRVKPSDKYVRVKITYRRKLAVGGFEEFYAWGQPLFAKN